MGMELGLQPQVVVYVDVDGHARSQRIRSMFRRNRRRSKTMIVRINYTYIASIYV